MHPTRSAVTALIRSPALAALTLFCAGVPAFGLPPAPDSTSTPDPAPWPARVLVTNDDGIEDEDRLVALARAFAAAGAEVFVAVSRDNRSGTGNLTSRGRGNPELMVERLQRHEAPAGPAEAFYVVDGYPADCVLFALGGPLRDAPPDLVVSGINGGANLAEAWLGSGTIGAARIAAYLGVPALAVSGIDEDDPEAPRQVAEWVVRLAASALVRELPPGAYLTIALPDRPLAQAAGIRVARRSGLTRRPILSPADEQAEASGTRQVWRVSGAEPSEPEPETDVPLHDAGYVVITPMHADEHDEGLLERLREQLDSLPAPAAPQGARTP
jgi:5'-nucleotidase